LMFDFLEMEVSASGGEGNGESLNRLSVARHELILADAGYCSVAGIEYVQQRGADVLIRINPQAFVAYSRQGKRFTLLTRLRGLSQAGQVGEWQVTLRGPTSSFGGRVCAVRKSENAIEQAHRRLHRRASKKQMSTKPETLEVAKYVVVFTTRNNVSAAEILEWYRTRWQIELVFKRLKRLVQLGHLPKHDDRSSRAWIHGKLLVALLTQKLIRIGRDISPWGCILSGSPATEPVA
jgi:IS4 transposase